MLSVEEAKTKGINACIDRIGHELCKEYADNATSAYGRRDDFVDCFVGLNDEHEPVIDLDSIDALVLTEERQWKYSAECSVRLSDGWIDFCEE